MPAPANPADREASESPIRVVLADRFAVTRVVLRALLDGESGTQVIGEARDLSALRACMSDRAAVLVLDLAVLGGSSFEELRRLHEEWPRSAIVALTMESNLLYAERVLEAGASGLVLKYMADGELPEAIRRAARGREFISPRVVAESVRRTSHAVTDLVL